MEHEIKFRFSSVTQKFTKFIVTVEEIVNLTATVENQTQVRVRFNNQEVLYEMYNFDIYKRLIGKH